MNHEIKNLNGIDYIEGGDVNSPDKIVCFHGYGADMMDLASLSRAIRTRKNFHWIFPNGTIEVPIGPHMTGRGWFPIDFEAYEKRLKSGESFRRYPPGLESSRAKSEKFLKGLNADFSRMYIGGFSQGSMLTMDLICETDIQPKGVVLLSSTWLNDERWTKQIALKKGLKYYQSHGTRDQVLPIELARMLHEKLDAAGWDGHFAEFGGGHEIPMNVIQDVASFLQ